MSPRLLLSLGLALAGCATTPYIPESFQSGVPLVVKCDNTADPSLNRFPNDANVCTPVIVHQGQLVRVSIAEEVLRANWQVWQHTLRPSPDALRNQAAQEDDFINDVWEPAARRFPWRRLGVLLGWGLLVWVVCIGLAKLRAWGRR